MPSSTCKGKTQAGKKCKSSVKRGTEYCHRHTSQADIPFIIEKERAKPKCIGKTQAEKRCKSHAAEGSRYCKKHALQASIHTGDKRIRCKGKTQAGKRCSLKSMPGRDYCTRHNSVSIGYKSGKIPARKAPVKKAVPLPKNYKDVCPICLEGDEENEGEENDFSRKSEAPDVSLEKPVYEPLHVPPCGHRIHLSCSENLRSMWCPVCKAPDMKFPVVVTRKIRENQRIQEEERREEQRRSLPIEAILARMGGGIGDIGAILASL